MDPSPATGNLTVNEHMMSTRKALDEHMTSAYEALDEAHSGLPGLEQIAAAAIAAAHFQAVQAIVAVESHARARARDRDRWHGRP